MSTAIFTVTLRTDSAGAHRRLARTLQTALRRDQLKAIDMREHPQTYNEIVCSSRGNECAPACPRCGNNYLHHGKIVAYERCEDAPRVLRIEVGGGGARLEWVTNDSRNPSTRRHGLSIEFCCENCGRNSELTIAQHKGESLLGWR
jgi:hypothetical protein